MLHGGLGVDHTLYQRSLGPLTERLELVLFDHRGNGRSGRPALETITIEQLADDAAALAGGLGLGTVVVLGHSFGGFVAQELALRHPDVVRALLLVATTPGQLGTGESEDDYRGLPPPPEFLEIVAQVPTTDEQLGEGMRALAPFYAHQCDPDALRALFDGTVYSRDAMVQGFAALAAWSAVDRLGQIRVPTLVVAGRHDVLTSAAQAHRIADRVPASERLILDHSGHMPWIDEPDRFFAVVTEWLARVAG